MSEENNDGRFSLSRRKALAGIGSIGAAVGFGGIGTYAQLTDADTDTVTFTVGGIDGQVDAGAQYNGETLQNLGDGVEVTQSNQGDFENVGFEKTGELGLNFELTDVKPGDWGCFSFDISVKNNPAWVAACIGYTNNIDDRAYEPEADVDPNHDPLFAGDAAFAADSSYGSPGELDNNLLVIPFYKGSGSVNSPDNKFNPCSFFDTDRDEFSIGQYKGSGAVNTHDPFWDNQQEDLDPLTLYQASQESAIDSIQWADGTADSVDYTKTIALGPGCFFLNGDNPGNDNTQPASPLDAGDNIKMGWDWHLPFDTGNEVMGDSLDLQLGFIFGQERWTTDASMSSVFNASNGTNPNDT